MTTDTVIYNGDDANTVKALEGVDKKLISFGRYNECDYSPANITYNRGAFAEFDVMHKGEKIAHLKLNIPGEHNILNSLAAFAAAKNAGCSDEESEKSISSFGGAGRRFEEIADYVLANAKSGDIIITLGCGDIYKCAKIMVEKLK